MATHRSLNKLEFKAHMSIHDFVAVPEGELHEAAAFTKDRLGKKHLLVDEHGASRVGNLRKKTVALAAALFFLCLGSLEASSQEGPPELSKKKGPNVQVSNADPEVHSVDSWMNKDDDKPVFYKDASTAVGFNDDGDPNVSTRF